MHEVTVALPEMRAMAEALMVDAGVGLRLLDNEWVLVDGIEVQATATLFFAACKVQTAGVQPREAQVGGRTAVEVRTELHLPADTAPLSVGDIWEITAAHPLSLSVVGQRLRVTAPVAGTFKTARRYQVEEVVS
ncbi:DUF6093 family protein [uncultured Arthrobacter sp.]|uniref:DUF6093 family protein n=1 Tax=uncultured Arthrobacter sp. TaxID=114050 RepID=UPI0025F26999|nr:DUF6093 family protein [uncultured Arthrobacter sp.]